MLGRCSQSHTLSSASETHRQLNQSKFRPFRIGIGSMLRNEKLLDGHNMIEACI